MHATVGARGRVPLLQKRQSRGVCTSLPLTWHPSSSSKIYKFFPCMVNQVLGDGVIALVVALVAQEDHASKLGYKLGAHPFHQGGQDLAEWSLEGAISQRGQRCVIQIHLN